MTRAVNDSIEAILIIYGKIKNGGDFTGLESSVSLLPEYLTTPYEEPLGNMSSSQRDTAFGTA